MTLGERCDEIVRLIDETLGSMTTPVPARLRRKAAATAATPAPTPMRRLADPGRFTPAPDAGPSAA